MVVLRRGVFAYTNITLIESNASFLLSKTHRVVGWDNHVGIGLPAMARFFYSTYISLCVVLCTWQTL